MSSRQIDPGLASGSVNGRGRDRHVKALGACAAAFVTACIGCGPAAAQSSWQPSRNVELIVQAGPGGASDQFARLMQRALSERKFVDPPVLVVNRPGGGGALAFNYLNQHAGDGHYILVATSTMLTAHATGASPFNYTDFSPISLLSTEYTAVAVRADSPIKSGKDFLARVASAPQDVTIGLAVARGNANHISVALAAKAMGVDPKRLKIVVFKASQEAVTAVLGGHIDVLAAPVSGALQHVTTGKIRILAVNSAQRLKGVYATIPTWKDQGVDTSSGNWRGVLGPKGMSDAQATYWEAVFGRMVVTPDWKQYLEKNALEDFYLDHGKTARFLESEYKELVTVLREIGLTGGSTPRQ